MEMQKKWEELSLEEKSEQWFASWLSPKGVKFVSPEAEKAYKERITRLKDAIQLKKTPDRVPIFPIISFFPAFYAGMTPEEAMYDYDKTAIAWRKYTQAFGPDLHFGAFQVCPGRVFDILDYKLYGWPGHGVSPRYTYQCIEREYMKADEYDALIQDPSDFWLRLYIPRIFGSLEPLRKLAPFTDILEMPLVGGNLASYGTPEVQTALESILKAGREALRWAQFVGSFDKEMTERGFPNGAGGMTKAPFDAISDTLRGTHGIICDMYRQPDKLLEAMGKLVPLMVKMGISSCRASGIPIVFIPLHKGADGFMSDEQYRTFYWPTLYKVILGLINEGLVPMVFAEGAYNSRLEVIAELPKGKTMWFFDQTNMAKAKEILGDTICIAGNVPSALLQTGTPQQIKDYCKILIDVVGKGGGFIMSNGAVIDEAKPENVRTMIDFTKEYGVYSFNH